MAADKDKFLLRADMITTIEKMSDDQAGKFFKHILNYVNDKNPEAPDPIIDLVFEPFKQELKKDLKKWEENKDKKSGSAQLGNLKRWHTDLYKQVESGKLDIEEALKIAKHRKTSQCDKSDRTESQSIANIAVSDSVSVSVSVEDKSSLYEGEDDFIEDWAKARKHFDKHETHLGKLSVMERQNFRDLAKIHPRPTFQNAIVGMFRQANMYPANRVRPKHFLENFDKYLDCKINDIQLFKEKDVGKL